MKGKKLLSLISLFAGAAIVGTTFAAWAVTDNADPFGIKISPGSIPEDTKEFVTLSYGNRAYSNVENLASGKPRLGATVNLVADTSEGHNYTGYFNITLVNQTQKSEGARLLINYLNVSVYDVTIEANAQGEVTTDLSKLTPIGYIPTAATEFTTDIEVEVYDATPKPVYVVVSLAEVNASELADIKDDVVYLQMDWNPKLGTGDVTASTVYFQGVAGRDTYVHAWNAKTVNKEYPGEKMTEVSEGLYSYELSAEFADLLFVQNDKTTGAELYKSVDLTIDATKRAQTPCYDATSSTWIPTPTAEVLDKDYYLVGTFNGWKALNAYGLTVVENGHYKIENVTIEAGGMLKIRDKTGTNWYGEYGTESGNITIGDAGTYNFHFYTNPGEGNPYIVCSKVS